MPLLCINMVSHSSFMLHWGHRKLVKLSMRLYRVKSVPLFATENVIFIFKISHYLYRLRHIINSQTPEHFRVLRWDSQCLSCFVEDGSNGVCYCLLCFRFLLVITNYFTYGYFISSGIQELFFASLLLQNLAYFSFHKSSVEASAACFFPYLEYPSL